MVRLRRSLLALALVVVGACGSDDSEDPAAAGGSSTTRGGDTTVATSDGAPGTTADLDGREPDAVEPPPADVVPVTAVPAAGSSRTTLPGFGEVVIEVRRVDGDTVEWCVL